MYSPGTTTRPRYRDVRSRVTGAEGEVRVDGVDLEVRVGLGRAGSRYSKACERIMLRSCGGGCWLVLVESSRGWWEGRGERGEGKRRGEERTRTESVHLNIPRNMRVSVVVMRRVLFSSEER